MSLILRSFHCLPHRHATALRLASIGLLSTLWLAIPAQAAAIDETIPTADGLAQLELRASQASPREQCFLYTQIVHSMTEKAGKEFSSGDTDAATSTLKQVNHYAHLIQLNLAHDTKRLKDAQELMHHTTYRLAQYLHLVSDDDRQTVQETLKQLNQVNDDLLAQVFAH